ncbi:MAG: RraA family protein [Endozoicomonas sp. (ex Botrylloides leachii)]|nr:RraA family protein [Endozoicomonas sp. (ex Botrylloides leachii)]
MLTTLEKQFKDRILNLDTSVVSDALDSLSITGGLLDIKTRNPGKKMAGPAFTVRYAPITPNVENFQNAGNYIDEVLEGHIVVVDNQGRLDCTSWGGILTKKSISKNIGGTVVFGSIRDINEIKNLHFPVFSSNVFMVSGKNRARVVEKQRKITINNVSINPTDWIFGDDNGVLVIPFKDLNKVIDRAEKTKLTEKRIHGAISEGVTLEKAREKYGYSTPWEEKNEHFIF